MNSIAQTQSSPAIPTMLIIGLTLLAMATISSAAPTAYESFNYAAGNLDNGAPATGDGFSGNWTCGVSGWIIEGLTYPGLPVADGAMRSTAARQFTMLSTPLSSGTKWIGFLYKTSEGNPGANINGVYFPNGGTGLWFGFGLNPYSATQGYLGIGAMDTTGTSAKGATSLAQLVLGTYGATYLVVLKIEFDTSGNNDTVTVYLNPLANQSTPGVAPAGTHDAFDVGTIAGIGLNVSGAGENFIDEIRVGDTYADVVEAVTVLPDAPAGLNATPGANQVSLGWTAATGSPVSYNVKRATNSGGPYATIGTATAPTVSYTDSILGGSTYYYVVSAVNGMGESNDTAPVSATPFGSLPLVLDIDPGVGIAWFASNSVTYQIQWAAEDLGTNTVWNDLGSPTTGNGATNTVFDPAGPPHNVYQVLSIQ